MQQSDKFTLRIDQDHIDFLKKEATKEGLSLSAYIRRMLNAHLDKTRHRAIVANDIQDRKWGCDGEEASREWQSEESAHCAMTD